MQKWNGRFDNSTMYLVIAGKRERAGASTILIFTSSMLVFESAKITTPAECETVQTLGYLTLKIHRTTYHQSESKVGEK